MGIVRSEWFTGICPNCGKGDWCQQHSSGVYMCRRHGGDGLVESLDRWSVPYWIYRPPGMESVDLAPSGPEVEAAEAEDLDRVYKTLLSRLVLSDAHRESLRARGMSDETIDRHCFRSWPESRSSRRALAASLYREFGELCRRVPGWYVYDGRPMLAGGSGIAIPMSDLKNRVCAVRIRSDQASKNKYYWLSSGHPSKGGASSGIHARLAWPGRRPRLDDRAAVVRITEGEFKSVILAEATGVPTLSAPGVALWALALPWLRWLRASKVLLCYDADVTTNRDVAQGFLAARSGLRKHGFDVAVETWKERVGA